MANIENTQPHQTNSSNVTTWLRIALLAVFLIAAVLTAYLTYHAVRDFITSYEMTDLPGVTIHDATPRPGETSAQPVLDPGVPLQSGNVPAPPAWDGAKRVTLLVMGLDYRDWEAGEGPPRTDTMILLTIDPLAQTAGMLSIPRDLWVNIPGGYNYGRINTAYQLGQAFNYPNGGGPGLAMATVEELLGVPIDYYAQIDFAAFVRFIDEIDGVKINVPEKIVVDPLGDNNTKTLKPGVQTLPGDLALAYARARKTEGGDFDRAQRQQQVIMAIRARLLQLDMLPKLIARSGVLYQELSAGIHTNLSLDQAVRLAWLASQIPEENIKKGVIAPPEMVNFATSPDGEQQVLKPITEKIRLLRDEIFTNTGPISPATASMDAAELMKAEGARIAVLNGSYTQGLASRTTEYLQSLGMNVVKTDNAQKAVGVTEITFYTGKPYTVKFLLDLMGIQATRVFHFYNPDSPVDVEITLGDDWVNSNQLP